MSVDEFIPTSGVFPRAGSVLKKLIFAVRPAIVRLAPAPLTLVPAGWHWQLGNCGPPLNRLLQGATWELALLIDTCSPCCAVFPRVCHRELHG